MEQPISSEHGRHHSAQSIIVRREGNGAAYQLRAWKTSPRSFNNSVRRGEWSSLSAPSVEDITPLDEYYFDERRMEQRTSSERGRHDSARVIVVG
jgi:hypothetical protein